MSVNKWMWGVLAAICLIGSTAAAGEISSSDAKRVQEAAAVLRDLHEAPDKDVPQELWQKAECVIVVPGLMKAAFIFGGEYGRGLMSCRKGGEWGSPIFMRVGKGSWGLQIGAQSIDLILLVMNKGGVEKMLKNQVSLGVEASAAAGPVGRDARAATDAQLKAEVLSYSRTQGLFAGIDLSGGVIKIDRDDNAELYGKNADPREIVVNHSVRTPAAAMPFVAELGRH